MGMRSPKTLRKHFREELQQGARAEVVEVRTADKTGPSGRCVSITVVLGVGASGSEATNNSGRKRVARLLASLQNSHEASFGAASLAQSLTIQGAELLDRSGSPLRLLTEPKDLLSGAKRASMDSESEGSRGGSKAGERNSGEEIERLRKLKTKALQVVGFEYRNQVYASLSHLAQHIAGTRWNGYHFFGLRKEWQG